MWELFKDKNEINEKNIIGFASFILMVMFAITDLITGFCGQELVINNTIFNSFVVITLGCFGISSFEKVKTKMGALLKAGEAEDLTSAYNKAIRLDDDLYKKSLENEKTLAKKEEEKRRKLAVEKARKVKPKSGNPPKGSTQATDLDSMLMSSIESAGVTTS